MKCLNHLAAMNVYVVRSISYALHYLFLTHSETIYDVLNHLFIAGAAHWNVRPLCGPLGANYLVTNITLQPLRRKASAV
jgi:hypothetical protein